MDKILKVSINSNTRTTAFQQYIYFLLDKCYFMLNNVLLLDKVPFFKSTDFCYWMTLHLGDWTCGRDESFM